MFVINMLAGAWIKYDPYKSASIASNVIMGVALMYLVYAHSRWAPYLTSSTSSRRGRDFAVSSRPCHAPVVRRCRPSRHD